MQDVAITENTKFYFVGNRAGIEYVGSAATDSGDSSGNGARYQQVRVDGARLDHAIDLELRLAENRNRIARGLECAFRGLLVGNRLL